MGRTISSVYDIMTRIPELYSRDNDEFGEPLGAILDTIRIKSNITYGRLKKYFGADLTIAPYLTYPVKKPNSNTKDSFLNIPTLLITDSTNREPETYSVIFSDSTAFQVNTVLMAPLGSGNVSTDFTSSDGIFKIESTKWRGTFAAGDRIFFSLQTHEDILRLLVSYMVACQLLKGRYVSESANAITGLQMDYCEEVEKMWENIENGNLELEVQKVGQGQPPTSNEKWLGYNVDVYGLTQDPPTS
jgi:hypothetical protein